MPADIAQRVLYACVGIAVGERRLDTLRFLGAEREASRVRRVSLLPRHCRNAPRA
jgi:hypothetical protein